MTLQIFGEKLYYGIRLDAWDILKLMIQLQMPTKMSDNTKMDIDTFVKKVVLKNNLHQETINIDFNKLYQLNNKGDLITQHIDNYYKFVDSYANVDELVRNGYFNELYNFDGFSLRFHQLDPEWIEGWDLYVFGFHIKNNFWGKKLAELNNMEYVNNEFDYNICKLIEEKFNELGLIKPKLESGPYYH